MSNNLEETFNKNFFELINQNRLSSYKFNKDISEDKIIEYYLFNIKISQAFYPILSFLEICLRNKINDAIEKFICKNWLIEEIKKQNLLLKNEYKILLEAKDKLIKNKKQITNDRLTAELSFGFWVHLCTKKYKNILWIKKGFFEEVFPNYQNAKQMDKISSIYPYLHDLLYLRNRIFHHEIIINNKFGYEIYYDNAKLLLTFISKNLITFINKIDHFESVSKQKP